MDGGKRSVRIVTTGAAGMIGARFCARLVREGGLGGRAVSRLTMSDLIDPSIPGGAPFAIEARAEDLTDPTTAERLIAEAPDVVVHLAATIQGEGERSFANSYAINFDAARHLVEAIRRRHEASGGRYRPRFVYASSIAVYGAPLPDVVDEDFIHQPHTSYGAQKAMVELLLADASRKGYLDAVALRLPTIVVRPGAPTASASGFFSNILREPLHGREAILPVSEGVRHWFASPRAAVGFLVRAATMDTSALGLRRALTMPGVSATVGDEIAALRRIAGAKAVALIRRRPDPAFEAVAAGWPKRFETTRATAIGFAADADFDAILRAYVEDEMGGGVAG